MKYFILLFTVTIPVFMATTDNPMIDLHSKFWAFVLSLYVFMSIVLIIEIICERTNKNNKDKQ